MPVFVEDPWSRIVAVHWKDDDEPPPNPDGYSCGSFWSHISQTDAWIEVEQTGVITRYPYEDVLGNYFIQLTTNGVVFGQIGSAPKPYNVAGTDVISYDLRYDLHRHRTPPRPGSLPMYIHTQSIGWGWALMRSSGTPWQFPPRPATPQVVFYSEVASYPAELVVGELHYVLVPPVPEGNIAIWVMGSNSSVYAPDYQAYVDYYFGGSGVYPFIPPGGFDENISGSADVDFRIKLNCRHPPPSPG